MYKYLWLFLPKIKVDKLNIKIHKLLLQKPAEKCNDNS